MYFPVIDSTNLWLLDHKDALCEYDFVYTDFQTAGRGQQGTRWQSKKGENLLCSILLHPTQEEQQHPFRLTMLCAVAVAKTLVAQELECKIKWPNDIYIGDKKVCGMLLESKGGVVVAGIGLNVNQLDFDTDIPNATSMRLVTGKTYQVQELLSSIIDQLKVLRTTDIKEQYMALLYRTDGFYPYREVQVSVKPMTIAQDYVGDEFRAKIMDVADDGQVVLQHENGTIKTYLFKELKYIII